METAATVMHLVLFTCTLISKIKLVAELASSQNMKECDYLVAVCPESTSYGLARSSMSWRRWMSWTGWVGMLEDADELVVDCQKWSSCLGFWRRPQHLLDSCRPQAPAGG
jgi:hypothetical protein